MAVARIRSATSGVEYERARTHGLGLPARRSRGHHPPRHFLLASPSRPARPPRPSRLRPPLRRQRRGEGTGLSGRLNGHAALITAEFQVNDTVRLWTEVNYSMYKTESQGGQVAASAVPRDEDEIAPPTRRKPSKRMTARNRGAMVICISFCNGFKDNMRAGGTPALLSNALVNDGF